MKLVLFASLFSLAVSLNTTCGDLRAAYRTARCCGGEPDKLAPLPPPARPASDKPALSVVDELDARPINPLGLSFPGENGPKIASELGSTGFHHSVASGSPTAHSVIIWTRYTPAAADAVVPVTYRMAVKSKGEASLDPNANSEMITGTAMAKPEHDWVIKLDVNGLESNTEYVFAFIAEGKASRIGTTRTAPAAGEHVDELHYAFFSCSHWAFGYFHAYDIASTMEKLDFWVHVGDYIYEYPDSTYTTSSSLYRTNVRCAPDEDADVLSQGWWSGPSTSATTAHKAGVRCGEGVQVDPAWEIVSLEDYRRRHAQYVTDRGLSNLRARAPMIATWDDHEVTNNFFMQGANNHQTTCSGNRTHPASTCSIDEGHFIERAHAAAQAYMEWMPIRRGPKDQTGIVDVDITQVVEWGDLLTMVSVDTRLAARSSDYGSGGSAPGEHSDGNPSSGLGSVWMSATSEAYTSSSQIDSPEALEAAEAELEAATRERWEPTRKQIGDDALGFIREKFAESKAAGKPWQVYATGTPMNPQVPPDLRTVLPSITNASKREALAAWLDDLIATMSFARGNAIACRVGAPWYNDNWNSVSAERARFLEMVQEHAATPIVLAGDVHESWGDVLFADGNVSGRAVATHLTVAGVTSQGVWGRIAHSYWQGTKGLIQETFDLAESMRWTADAMMNCNPGMKYAGVKDKGFIAVKVTPATHIAEFININHGPDASHSGEWPVSGPHAPVSKSYEYYTARGNATAPYYCDGSFATNAGTPGSLEKQGGCEISFLSSHPHPTFTVPL